jgi:hypothetical protein
VLDAKRQRCFEEFISTDRLLRGWRHLARVLVEVKLPSLVENIWHPYAGPAAPAKILEKSTALVAESPGLLHMHLCPHTQLHCRAEAWFFVLGIKHWELVVASITPDLSHTLASAGPVLCIAVALIAHSPSVYHTVLWAVSVLQDFCLDSTVELCKAFSPDRVCATPPVMVYTCWIPLPV